MKGADEYARLFDKEQVGRLYALAGSHARGLTFHLYVLEDGYNVERGMYPDKNRSVEVFGVTGGNPGWTETYGWLKDGPWQDDFMSEVVKRKASLLKAQEIGRLRVAEAEARKMSAEQAILNTYKTGVEK